MSVSNGSQKAIFHQISTFVIHFLLKSSQNLEISRWKNFHELRTVKKCFQLKKRLVRIRNDEVAESSMKILKTAD